MRELEIALSRQARGMGLTARQEKLIAEQRAPRVEKAAVEAAKKKVAVGDVTKEVEQLFRDGLLVDLNIGAWTGLVKNTKEDLGIDPGAELPEYVVGLGMKRLCPDELAKTWMYHAQRARTILYSYSFTRFPLSGGAFVPAKALPAIIEKLEAEKGLFDEAWHDMIADFDNMRDTFIRNAPREHRPTLEKIYPSKAEVIGRFYFTYSAYTVDLPKRIAGLKVEEEQKAMARFRTELDKRVEGFLEESVKTLRAKAADICATVIDNVRSGKTVSQTNITTLSEYIDRFRSLNFVGDREMESRLTKLQHDLLDGIDLDDLKAKGGDKGLREALAAACDDIRQAAENVSDVSAVTGGYRRRIVL